MKISPFFRVVLFLVAVIAIVAIYKIIIEPALASPQIAENNGGQSGDTYRKSSICQPCSPTHIQKQVAEIMPTVPDGYKARGGRSTNSSNSSNACMRSNCVELTNICETKDKNEGDRMEECLLTEMRKYSKCGNVAFDARGGKSKRNVPTSLYIKIYKEKQSGQKV